AATATTATTKNIAKDIAENIAEAAKASTSSTHARLGIHARVAVLIIGRTLLFVGKHFVGFVGFFEFFLSGRIVRVAVRMIFHGHTAVGLFQICRRNIFGNTENLVVVALGHTLCRLAIIPDSKNPPRRIFALALRKTAGAIQTQQVKVLLVVLFHF